MKTTRFPRGWNEERVRKVLEHYESQSEDEAVAEDEAARQACTLIAVPNELVSAVQTLLDREANQVRKNGKPGKTRTAKAKARR